MFPRQLLRGLLNAGSVAAHEGARGQSDFRFTSPEAGLTWFDSAAPVDVDDAVAPKLVPAMRVKTRGLTRPDSRGRVWCTWDRALSPIAVFDGKVWKTVEQLPRGNVDNPVGFISTFQGAGGAMVFLDRFHRFHLFDDAGHIRADSAAEFLSAHAERLARALPQPCPSSDAFYFHLIKDSNGKVWWSNWMTDWGVVEGGKMIRAGDNIPEVEVKAGYRHEILFPVGDGHVVVFQAGSQPRGVVADVSGGRIAKSSDLPFHDVNRRQTAQLAVRDKKGRVWIATRGGSRAIDGTGKVVAEHRGSIVLEDRAGGLWFLVGDYANNTGLVRLSEEGKESVIAVPRLRPFWPLAESPDGTFWVVSGNELVHVRLQGDELAPGERFTVPASNYIWCDPQGRVWVTGSGREEEAVRLAVGKPL